MNKPTVMAVAVSAMLAVACGTEPKEKEKNTDTVKEQPMLFNTDSMTSQVPRSIKYEGDTVEYYPTGVIKIRGLMGGGMRQGQWVAFFPNGEVQSECQYRDNKKNGKSVVYREGGGKYWEGFYNMDNKVGKWRFWNDAGKVTEKDYGGQVPAR